MMTIKDRLENALRDAMRSHNELQKRTLRMALSAIRLAEIDKQGSLDENSILSILQKEIKSRREVILDAQRANRPDLVKAAEDEISVLDSYLPQQLSQLELESIVREVIEELGASSPTDMGKVMKVLLPRIQGRAASDQVSLLVRQELQKI